MTQINAKAEQDVAIPGAPDQDAAAARAAFIEAMSRAVTGVTVVTTAGEAGRFGLTVSAMCSVSADPPMLLVCINQRTLLASAIPRNRVFAVNVLRADQRRVAEVFSGRPRWDQPYDFGVASWETAVTGAPLLAAAVARFDCALDSEHQAGTHRIFIGRVLAASVNPGMPLVYARRGYGELVAFPRDVVAATPIPLHFIEDEEDFLEDWE
ncbi:MAG TPA: flavin reductase family protein [Thermomicrobiales bacterium]